MDPTQQESDAGMNETKYTPVPDPATAAQAAPPAVSVIIPAYNAAALIRETLESVFQQTYSDFEVLLVNDGSLDTAELEAAIRPFLNRLRYFRQENRGPSSARNLGIRQARGRYLALLDSDDLWLPHHLERQIANFAADSELGLVYANNLRLRGETAVGMGFDFVPQHGPATLESLLAEDCTVNTSSVVVSREAVLAAGLFDETINRCEDFDLWLRLAAHGTRIAYDREVQVVHRLGHGLSSNSESMKRGRAAVYRKAAARLPLSPSQKSMVDRKLAQLDGEIELELAKQYLHAGRFQDARWAVQRAHSIAPAVRLRAAAFALACCPRLLRWSYHRYLHILKGRDRKSRQRAGENAGIIALRSKPPQPTHRHSGEHASE